MALPRTLKVRGGTLRRFAYGNSRRAVVATMLRIGNSAKKTFIVVKKGNSWVGFAKPGFRGR